MKISEMIKALEDAKRENGDLPVTTFSGFIQSVRLTACKDGISYPLKPGSQNEISMEIFSEYIRKQKESEK